MDLQYINNSIGGNVNEKQWNNTVKRNMGRIDSRVHSIYVYYELKHKALNVCVCVCVCVCGERERERSRTKIHEGKPWITSGIKFFLQAIQVVLYRWQKTNVWKKLQPSHFFKVSTHVFGVLCNLKILEEKKSSV